MMAAVSASYGERRVILLEKNEKTGKKIYITGKGRCNVTTACQESDFLNGVITNPRFLYSSFSEFTNRDMVDFLNRCGLRTKVERGQRVFPVSDRSSDVIQTLVREMRKRKVVVKTHCPVKELLIEEIEEDQDTGLNRDKCTGGDKKSSDKRSSDKRAFGMKPSKKTYAGKAAGVVLESGEIIRGDAVILACGGKSYPSTGSDGSGYDLAAQAGHTICPPQPSLVPFTMKEKWCRDLSGLTLKNIGLTVKDGKKIIYEGFGEFLFTHFGVSGPLVLTGSTYLGSCQEALNKGRLTLDLDFKPALSAEALDKRFLREFDIYRNKKIINVIERMLPKKLVPVYLRQTGVDEDIRVRDISRKDRQRMVESMKRFTMHIAGVRGFEEAIVTRGGVSVKEVNPKTMESRKVKGLHIAGEMLDVDAVTGGYNLQIAWSTGYNAGKYA